MTQGRSIILDTDPGQDDALALYLALASPEVALDSVVTVAGNVPQPLVTDNTLALLEIAGRSDIPVYKGADRPLIRKQYTAEYVHGETGIDGANIPPATISAQAKHGVQHIVDTCLAADPNSVTLCPVGPLTNIALAIAMHPGIVDRIREIVWMGGAFDEPGNTKGVAEFNAYVDPHAVRIVLASGAPLTIFPLDVTHKVLLTQEGIERLHEVGTPVTAACAGMATFYEAYDRERYGFSGPIMHDPCVVAYLVDPELFDGRRMRVAVDYDTGRAQGRTFEDANGFEATVMFDAKAERVNDLFIERWSTL